MKNLFRSAILFFGVLVGGVAVASNCDSSNLNLAQRAAITVLDGSNFLWGMFAIMATIAVLAMAGGFFLEIAVGLWRLIKPMSDILAFVITAMWLYVATRVTGDWQSTMVFMGASFYIASVTWCLTYRNIKGKNSQGYFLLLLLGLVPIAIYFNVQSVGYLAAIALMGVLRFTIAVGPLCYGFGYEREDDVAGGTGAAFLLLVIFVGIYLSLNIDPSIRVLSVFMHGVFWSASVVCFVGLLIMSSKWYKGDSGSYWAKQLITLSILLGFAFLGITFHIPALTFMGIMMTGFYLLGKIVEVEAGGVFGFGVKTSIVAGLLFMAIKVYEQNREWVDAFASTHIPM